MTDFRDKTVLITGAASGIGRLLAQKIASQGGRIVLWDIDANALRDLSEELRGQGHEVFSHLCDVSDREAVYDRAGRVIEQTRGVDVLINNAGVVTGKPILEASDEEILRTFEINVLAHFWTVRAFLPGMVERNSGHIVTVASAAGLAAAPRLSDYSASKFAAVGFDEALRLELRDLAPNVRTTLVCPFYVATGMFAGVKTRFSWLLPILPPEYAADRILDAVRRNRQRLIMPRFVMVAPPLRVLPPRWFDTLLGFFGVTRSMDEFTGREGLPPGD